MVRLELSSDGLVTSSFECLTVILIIEEKVRWAGNVRVTFPDGSYVN